MWKKNSCLFWESNFHPSYLLTLAENTRRDLYRTKHNIHKRQTSTSPPGFKFEISAGEWPQNHTLDLAAIGKGDVLFTFHKYGSV